MVRKCRSYEAQFKSKVVIELLKGNKSMIEICAENKVSKTSAIEWRERAVNEMESIFAPEHEKQKIVKQLKQEIELLHKIIGEMTVENKFFKKKLLA